MVAMGFMVDNHTLLLRWLSTINPWLLCYNYNISVLRYQYVLYQVSKLGLCIIVEASKGQNYTTTTQE